MSQTEFLLHPELIEAMPVGAERVAHLMGKRIAETLIDDPIRDPSLSIVIRTLNEAARLEQLFEDIHHQNYTSNVEVIVVDNESTDRTQQVARHYGAKVLTIPRNEFTYPRSMNMGVAASSYDVVLLTVGHVSLSNTYNLHAGARHFRNNTVGGAFGTVLPNDNASSAEKLTALWCGMGALRHTHEVRHATVGTLGATAAMIAKPVWQELGRFDERYEAGGEDTVLARLMLQNGYDIINEPALTVHHSHGLDWGDTIKQGRAWRETLRAPQPFDRQAVFARRPDLRDDTTE